MATPLDKIKIQKDYNSELQRLSNPYSFFEDYPDRKEDFEEVFDVLPELYNDPSLLKNYDSDFAISLYAVVVNYPLLRTFICILREFLSRTIVEPYSGEDEKLARQFHSTWGVQNSRDLFDSIKVAKKPFDRDVYYKAIDNPSLQYRIQKAIDEDDFNSFDELILEHADEFKKFILCLEIGSLSSFVITSFLSLIDENSDESDEYALDLFQGNNRLIKETEGMPESIKNVLTAAEDNAIKVLKDPDWDSIEIKEILQSSYRYFIFVNVLFEGQMMENEKAAMDRILFNPFFLNLSKQLDKEVREELEGEKEERKQPDEQEQPKEKVVALPEGERKPTEQEEYVPHWPTDDELFGYDNNFDYHQFFKQSIFGLPLQVKASDVEKLISVLTSMGVIDEDLDTKLIFLSRYSGKKIPHLELHPIEWKYLSEDWEKALGYLIHITSVGRTDFAKGRSFFYYNKNGVKMMPDREALAGGGHAWALSGRLEKTRTPFEKALNKFLADYKESKMD